MRSRRRGLGLDVAGARPYRAGDDVRGIDHRASAKLSSVRGEDELVVREFLTEESVRVVVVVDRSPSMRLFPDGLPWLSKPVALVEAVRVILGSAADSHCLAGMLDASSSGCWLAPHGRTAAEEIIEQASVSTFDAPSHALDEGLTSMIEIERGLHAGTFVFVVSDFLRSPASSVWDAMIARGWDVIPVIMQDPVWEQSFPAVAGALLALADPASGKSRNVRLTEAEVSERRLANETRCEAVNERFETLGVDVVQISSERPDEVLTAFSSWAIGRREGALTVR
jgi:uncharacterized protein (DUF58 family)